MRAELGLFGITLPREVGGLGERASQIHERTIARALPTLLG